MVTSRDLLEARAFERRRLSAAFLTGCVDRSDAAVRPGRCLVAGLVLTGLLVGGLAVRAHGLDVTGGSTDHAQPRRPLG